MESIVDTRNYQEISSGLQGIVYERLGSRYVSKKELPENQGYRFRVEFAIHRKVSDAFTRYKDFSGFCVPQPYYFTPKEVLSPELLSRMPGYDQQPGDLITMERILPLPKVVRKALIQNFYPDINIANDEHLVTQLLGERGNKHCLARVYLGKRTIAMSTEIFALRNFPLTLDAMYQLSLRVEQFTVMIGSAYAIMHWAANITGDGVEFVLGTSTSTHDEFQHRRPQMYLLDFGQCHIVDMNEDRDEIFQALKESMVLQ